MVIAPTENGRTVSGDADCIMVVDRAVVLNRYCYVDAFTPLAVLVEKMERPHLATFVAFMAVLPLMFVPLHVVLWLVTNVLILIWR